MNFKIKNIHLNMLIQVLDSLELSFKESRMRTRFMRMLSKYDQEILYPEKVAIMEEYCTRNKEDNRPLFSDKEKGIYLFEDPENEEKAKKELADLLEEEFILPCDESNKMMLLSVANSFISDEEFKVSGAYADIIDDFYTQFENVIQFYEEDHKESTDN
jgi:hypothetical protein